MSKAPAPAFTAPPKPRGPTRGPWRPFIGAAGRMGTTVAVVHPRRKGTPIKDVIGWPGFDQHSHTAAEDTDIAHLAASAPELRDEVIRLARAVVALKGRLKENGIAMPRQGSIGLARTEKLLARAANRDMSHRVRPR